jgi:hypothetical protein
MAAKGEGRGGNRQQREDDGGIADGERDQGNKSDDRHDSDDRTAVKMTMAMKAVSVAVTEAAVRIPIVAALVLASGFGRVDWKIGANPHIQFAHGRPPSVCRIRYIITRSSNVNHLIIKAKRTPLRGFLKPGRLELSERGDSVDA